MDYHQSHQQQSMSSHDAGEYSSNGQGSNMILEQERFMPIANIGTIMRHVLPDRAKLSKEAKECIQECVTEFFLFVTSEAAEKCNEEKRKTITGDDLLAALEELGFDSYVPAMKLFLKKYKAANRGQPELSEDGHNMSAEMSHESMMDAANTMSVSSAVVSLPSNAAFMTAQPVPQMPQQPSSFQNTITTTAESANGNNHSGSSGSAHVSTTANSSAGSKADENPVVPGLQSDGSYYIAPTLRRVDQIFVDTTNQQHYVLVQSPGGTQGLIPLQLSAFSTEHGLQPLPLHEFLK